MVKVNSKEAISWGSDFLVEDFKIEEALEDGTVKESIDQNKVKIKGTAILATESRNGRVYELEELHKAKRSLKGVSIAVNHSENVQDIIGTVTNVIETGKGLDYEAVIENTSVHPYATEFVKNKKWNKVSVVAYTPNVTFNKEGKIVAKDIEFLGLDFVRFEGIKGASASVAEALENVYSESMKSCPKCDKEMPEKDMDSHMKTHDDMPKKKGENMENENKESNELVPILEKLVTKLDESSKLREELESLRSEIKSIKEPPKSKGDITTQSVQATPIVESFCDSKPECAEIRESAKNAFVKDKRWGGVFAAHPEELY